MTSDDDCLQKKQSNLAIRTYRSFLRKNPVSDNDDITVGPNIPTENSPLLQTAALRASVSDGSIISGCPADSQYEGIVVSRSSYTDWQHEAKVIASYAGPLIVTFFLQYSIDVSSVIAAGRLGKVELGAASLANMSAAITCFAAFQGLATSLDTLCSQAYGSGEKKLVGIYCQRMMLFLLFLSIPIAITWFFSERIIFSIIPDAESARLCSIYLKILAFAIPGYGAFETGKRFLQAQGLFEVTTYILLIGAPVNIFLMWLLIWKLDLGFIGAPISVAITRTLLPLLLVFYVKFFGGSQCWGGFSRRAFTNLGEMIRLAVPGMIMVVAEWLIFEIMTLVSARFGIEYLAMQSILMTISTLSYQIPFPLSVAASTRVARLIGAGRVADAKVAAKVAVVASCTCTFLNLIAYIIFRHQIPYIFTRDEDVARLVTTTLPLVGVTTFFDGVGVAAHGILRGIGKQWVGGPANLVAYYVISLPLALSLGIALQWKVRGLWMGTTVGLIVVSVIEYTYILMTDWEKAVMEAIARSAAG